MAVVGKVPFVGVGDGVGWAAPAQVGRGGLFISST